MRKFGESCTGPLKFSKKLRKIKMMEDVVKSVVEKSKNAGSEDDRQGGWPVTKFIDHDLRKDTKRKVQLLEQGGFPFTVFATVRPLSGMSDVFYILKQHKPCGKYEKYLKFYEKGEAFRGSRLSFTGEALAIISRIDAEDITEMPTSNLACHTG